MHLVGILFPHVNETNFLAIF